MESIPLLPSELLEPLSPVTVTITRRDIPMEMVFGKF
jgi:hypothetical protein